MNNNEKVIAINDIYFFYALALGEVLPIIKGISLDIYINELVGIIGPSGSGKSTLINLIRGIINPYSGSIIFKSEMESTKIMGYLPQDPKDILINDLTVIEWFDFIKSNSNLSEISYNELINEIKDDWELNPFLQSFIGSLSGGQMQRIALATVMLQGKKILLLDEPTSMLHKSMSSKVMKTIKKYIKSHNACVLVVTHSISVMEDCDKVYEIFNGFLRLSGKISNKAFLGEFHKDQFSLALDSWGRIILPLNLIQKIKAKDMVVVKFDFDKIIITGKVE